jgi:hypothetical protein
MNGEIAINPNHPDPDGAWADITAQFSTAASLKLDRQRLLSQELKRGFEMTERVTFFLGLPIGRTFELEVDEARAVRRQLFKKA